MRSLTMLCLLLVPMAAHAHQMFAQARVVGNQLKVEAYHDDDTPAQSAKVKVTFGDQVIAEGVTDERGLWLTAAPTEPGTYQVRVSGDGHVARATFDVGGTAVVAAPANDDERQRNTRTKWDRIGLGLGLIIGGGGMWFFFRRKPNQANAGGNDGASS